MAETTKTQYPWPRNSWAILTKIIRAWYTVERGNEVTQKKIAEVAGVQQSQVSTNKAFLQAIGIVNPDGVALTDPGKRIGLGLYSDNESTKQQGLQALVANNPLLRDLLDIVKGRGSLKEKDFSDEVALKTNGKTGGFVTGVGILQEILIGSGAIEVSGDTLRPLKDRAEEPYREPKRNEKSNLEILPALGLKRIPIPVSTSSVWWIEVGETPIEGEVERFLEMQKLMFGTK